MQKQELPELTPEMLEQNPGLIVLLFLVSAMMLFVSLASLATWGWMTYRASQGASILPLRTPWRPRLWSLIDVLVVFGLIVLTEVLFFGFASLFSDSSSSDSPPMIAIAAGGLAHLVAVLLGIAWIQHRYRQGREHTGFGPIPLRSFLVAFFVGVSSLPLVYLLMTIVSQASQTEYDHPLISSAAESGTLVSYLLGCFAAVVTAPIAEEIFFRVILQGWLQSIPFNSLSQILIGVPGGTEIAHHGPMQQLEVISSDELTQEPVTPTGQTGFDPPRLQNANESRGMESPQVSSNPYSPHLAIDGSQDLNIGATSPIQQSNISDRANSVVPPLWPSVIVGGLFGLAHIQAGWSCIPLAFLGAILGLVYRQTHSVWPCILIHATLNSLSMLMLGLIIMMKQAAN